MLLSHTMSKIDKISIAITREQHAKIKAAVDRGDYASTSEVIRTALREWELKEEMRRLEGERIARLWDEGIASGPGRYRDIEEIKTEARKRWKAQQRKRA
jgi:antitoxin ParD1/3/4